jgi:hypothetical protein
LLRQNNLVAAVLGVSLLGEVRLPQFLERFDILIGNDQCRSRPLNMLTRFLNLLIEHHDLNVNLPREVPTTGRRFDIQRFRLRQPGQLVEQLLPLNFPLKLQFEQCLLVRHCLRQRVPPLLARMATNIEHFFERKRFHRLPVIGHWSLVIGHWSLVIGHWSLVIGHWSLVIGGGLMAADGPVLNQLRDPARQFKQLLPSCVQRRLLVPMLP